MDGWRRWMDKLIDTLMCRVDFQLWISPFIHSSVADIACVSPSSWYHYRHQYHHHQHHHYHDHDHYHHHHVGLRVVIGMRTVGSGCSTTSKRRPTSTSTCLVSHQDDYPSCGPPSLSIPHHYLSITIYPSPSIHHHHLSIYLRRGVLEIVGRRKRIHRW